MMPLIRLAYTLQPVRPGQWVRTYRNKFLRIWTTDNGYLVFADTRMTRSYKGKPIRDFYSAIYAAFDLADPVEDLL